MKKGKKLLSILIKLIIGLGSVAIIYVRLKSDFTPEKMALLSDLALSQKGFLYFAICLLLVPVNWGLESHKWRLITRPVEAVSFKTASMSVYSGVCLGNLAPGRATEFLAKIIYFDINNRPKITVLHFVGGMFQLSVTVIAGFVALVFQLRHFGNNYSWMVYATSAVGMLLLIGLVFCIYRIDYILNLISRKISKQKQVSDFSYTFTTGALLALFGFSWLRYLTFFMQFWLLLDLFHPADMDLGVLSGIALYFLITTTLPMISVVEAAIRAAIALIVFRGSGVGNTALALTSVLIWLVNIIIPSLVGYFILLQQNFDFKLFKTNK